MTDRAVQPEASPGIADQRREQMLRAALDVIAERGFADARIADIAERTGISPALVIYYFKTKEALLTEAIRFYEDRWYAEGRRRLAALQSNASRLTELVAMNLLDDGQPDSPDSWRLWLDFWGQAARNPEVAEVRRRSDERWRAMIEAVVQAGQQAGEFAHVDPGPFVICLNALMDGLTVQIALREPAVGPSAAFEFSMRFAARELGFRWEPGDRARWQPGADGHAGAGAAPDGS
jgi:AcrR family transcriptional regulator